MDIIRKTKKNKFYYEHKRNGFPIKSKKILNHIKSMRIPPAYTNVEISSDKDSKIYAIARDSKDRKQYIYNPEYVIEQNEIKFCNLIHFGRKIKKIRRDILKNLNENSKYPSKDCVISLILYIVDKCNFRVGCVKYANLYNTFGTTTLKAEHIILKSNYFTIKFNGKKNVENKGKITHPSAVKKMAQIIKLNQNLDFLFYYRDKNNKNIKITEKMVNLFLKKYNNNLVVKMFRTWKANQLLLIELLKLPINQSESEKKKKLASILKKNALKMHHTAGVSKKNYVNNELLHYFNEDRTNFNKFVDSTRKYDGSYPTIDRMLNLFLKFLCT